MEFTNLSPVLGDFQEERDSFYRRRKQDKLHSPGRLKCSWYDSALRVTLHLPASLDLQNHDFILRTPHEFFISLLHGAHPLVKPPSLDFADRGWKPGSPVAQPLLLAQGKTPDVG